MTLLAPLLATWLALSPDGSRISVAWEFPGEVQHFDARTGKPAGKDFLRNEPPLGGRFRLDRFGGSVTFLTPPARTIPVCREPIAAAEAPDRGRLFVACHLPEQAATAPHVAARVVVVDAPARAARESILLPNGSTSVRGIAASPDGRWVFVTHILARYTVHTSQIEQGWMNTNAISILDAGARKLHATVLLDDVDNGAANPWGVAVSPDSKTLYVTHAGTHELSVIDIRAMLARVAETGGDPAERLSFLLDIRERVKLPGKGPRAVVAAGGTAWVAEYFSRTVTVVSGSSAARFAGVPGRAATLEQRGEMLFHDASLCLQQWQSCSSCHPDGRADGLNWDLLNDGLGNPKNTRSLMNAHRMNEAMWTGVRPSASHAIRTGMKFILFAEPSEESAEAMEAWLRSLKPVPRPGLNRAAVERGRKLFLSARTGCAACHPAPLYSDNATHDVGTHAQADYRSDLGARRSPQLEFRTPSLIEVWRTAPYLHDGRYATLEDAIRAIDGRGKTSGLSDGEVKDLAAFLRSL